jgi:hypothetical protein
MKLSDDGHLKDHLGWWLTLEELESWLKDADLPKYIATAAWETFVEVPEPVGCNDSCLCPVSLCIKETKSMEEQEAFSHTVGIQLRDWHGMETTSIYPVPYHLQEFTTRYDLRCDDQWADECRNKVSLTEEGDHIQSQGGKEARPYQIVPAETARLLALSAIESMKEGTEESNEDYAVSL